MVFLNKTREKGLKSLTKEKKKPQKPNEKPASLPLPLPAAPQDQQQPLILTPIHVNLPIKTPKSEPPLPASSQTQALGGSPWWVSDVTFLIEGRRIPGHKVVLQSRSQYFTKLFQASAGDVTLEITDFSHDIFSQFVRWIYGGKKEISLQDAPELARCAEHFEAPELLQLCQKLLEEAAKEEQLQIQPQEYFPAPATLPSSSSSSSHHHHHHHHQPVQHSSLASFSQELPPSSQPALFHPLPLPQTPTSSYIDLQGGYAPLSAPPQILPLHPSSTLILGDERLEFAHPHHQQQLHHPDALMGEPPILEPLDEHFVMAAASFCDYDDAELGYGGMNLWSNDPVLFNLHDPSSADPLRTMEIY